MERRWRWCLLDGMICCLFLLVWQNMTAENKMLYAVLHCNEWCTVRYISGQRNTDKGGCGRANSQMKHNVLIVGWGAKCFVKC